MYRNVLWFLSLALTHSLSPSLVRVLTFRFFHFIIMWIAASINICLLHHFTCTCYYLSTSFRLSLVLFMLSLRRVTFFFFFFLTLIIMHPIECVRERTKVTGKQKRRKKNTTHNHSTRLDYMCVCECECAIQSIACRLISTWEATNAREKENQCESQVMTRLEKWVTKPFLYSSSLTIFFLPSLPPATHSFVISLGLLALLRLRRYSLHFTLKYKCMQAKM